ncbi:MAG TPA: ATP-binding protein [Kofleriaceae bacterium]|nr:ATP-binding protein [Kofleriaceae bacterium]
MERELDLASALINEMVSVASLPETEITRVPRREAIDRYQQFEMPAAIVDRSGIRLANVAWRELFQSDLPSWAATSFDVVLRARTSVHLPDIPLHVGERMAWLAAMLSPARVPGDDAVLVVCSEMTDAAIAREISVAMEALVWSGRNSTPEIADHCNLRMREALGTSDLRDWQTFVDPASLAAWKRALADAARQRNSVTVELKLRDVDGAVRNYAGRVGVGGNMRWYTAVVEQPPADDADRQELVERLRAAQAAAQQAHKLKDQVLAAVSHELRSPVTTMMLWERVLRDPAADQTARMQALDAIHQSATAQSKIVADLLDMSRAISGKLHVDIRSVDVGNLVGSAVEGMLPAALAKRISLVHEGASSPGDVQGDAARLRQVIDNLLSNAIKFTEQGGQVTVRIQRKRPVMVIEVADNGCGIATDMLDKIFEPFRQGEDSISRRDGGLGLGLAIAKQIVELHHGTLTAASDGPGRGACMTLTLPIAGHRRAPLTPEGVASARGLDTIRVLVVDDDERVRNALALLLARAGALVESAESATVARERMASRAPHVLLCDIAMPDEDGYTFIRSVRASGNKIPAIALTAYASRADAERAIASGFDIHVAKPVDFERLVASVSQLVHGGTQNRI